MPLLPHLTPYETILLLLINCIFIIFLCPFSMKDLGSSAAPKDEYWSQKFMFIARLWEEKYIFWNEKETRLRKMEDKLMSYHNNVYILYIIHILINYWPILKLKYNVISSYFLTNRYIFLFIRHFLNPTN